MNFTLVVGFVYELKWEPLIESQPTEQFICQYGGPFTTDLQINRRVIDRFLSIASLDGPVVLKESLLRPGRSLPDINPDGSVTSKGYLRWGDKLRLPTREPNVLFQVETEKSGGYTVAINGGMILEKLREKTNLPVRELADPFINEYNHYLRVGLKEALLKDKLTFAGDPFFSGRLYATYAFYHEIFNLAHQNNFNPFENRLLILDLALFAIWNTILSSGLDVIYRNVKQHSADNLVAYTANIFSKIWTCRRRSAKNIYQGLLLPPFEFDRLIGAYGYLDYQILKGNSLVKAVTD